MVRAAVLASGEGSKLQTILDAVSQNEIPNIELVAVICPQRDAYAMKRAISAEIPAYFVDPELFPTNTSHSMAMANKLKDMDIELVILADYGRPLGVIPYQFRNRIIGTCPLLYPAFDGQELDPIRAVLERGVKITGATAYFADGDGGVGGIILQKAVEVLPEDTMESLAQRVTEDSERELLRQAVSLYCAGRLQIRGKRVMIRTEEKDE